MSYPGIPDEYPYNDNYYRINSFDKKSHLNRNSIPKPQYWDKIQKSQPRKGVFKTKMSKVNSVSGIVVKIEGQLPSMKSTTKFVFILICCGFCGYQTIDVFNKYSSFPMNVNVIVQEMKLLQLPGVTICNNNMQVNNRVENENNLIDFQLKFFQERND